jgi:hypothetical protein
VFFKLLLPPGAQGTRARRRGEAFVGEECAPPPERVNSRSRTEAGRRRDVIARPGPARPGPLRGSTCYSVLVTRTRPPGRRTCGALQEVLRPNSGLGAKSVLDRLALTGQLMSVGQLVKTVPYRRPSRGDVARRDGESRRRRSRPGRHHATLFGKPLESAAHIQLR